jgi:2',3'-cyclic-nucleotide 2'-phosphodiesterase (5'-nucleotidase family)
MKSGILMRGVTGLALGLMVLLPITGCGQTSPSASPAAQAAQPIEFTILNTNDVHGYVEPCG